MLEDDGSFKTKKVSDGGNLVNTMYGIILCMMCNTITLLTIVFLCNTILPGTENLDSADKNTSW